MVRRTDIPQFGLLNGVRVVYAAMSVAAPFAASMMADMGADVIWIENTASPDVARSGTGMAAEMNRRNQRALSLDIPSEEGLKVFLDLLKETDIFIESAKGGQYQRWGVTDELMWSANPKLVIVHVSGYGQSGVQEYVTRASYDPIGQAFGGMMYTNSVPDRKPFAAELAVADYYTGFMALSSALAAYINAQKTGKGESIDVSQYESVLRCLDKITPETWNNKRPFVPGNLSGGTAGFDSYLCKDGNYVYMLLIGPNVLKKVLPLLGLEIGTEEFPAGAPVYRWGTPGGDKLEATVTEFCMQRTADEVEAELNNVGAPCTRVLTYQQMLEHPHYQARESVTKWKTMNGEELYGMNITPKMKNFPGQIWRPCPNYGQDNEAILSDLGYSKDRIRELYESKTINKK